MWTSTALIRVPLATFCTPTYSTLYTHLFQPISALPRGSGECNKKGDGEHKEEREAEVEGPPDYSLQKEEIQPLLSQKLRKGDEWYVFVSEVGVRVREACYSDPSFSLVSMVSCGCNARPLCAALPGTSLTRSGSNNGRSMLALMRRSSSVLEKIQLIQDPLTIPISSNVSPVNYLYMCLDTQTNVTVCLLCLSFFVWCSCQR